MEKLICDCGNFNNHIQYIDENNETVVECTICGRFLKFTEPQPEVPVKSEPDA